jgi:hypothetical protein
MDKFFTRKSTANTCDCIGIENANRESRSVIFTAEDATTGRSGAPQKRAIRHHQRNESNDKERTALSRCSTVRKGAIRQIQFATKRPVQLIGDSRTGNSTTSARRAQI